jgi:hypothetical protein
MSLTITQPLGRPPAFAELQSLAGQYNVRIRGNDLAGDFCHPDPEQPRVTGHYVFDPNGDLHGDFTGHVLGKLAGRFSLVMGKAEITVTEKPLLLPEAVLKSKLSIALKDFCDRFAARQ